MAKDTSKRAQTDISWEAEEYIVREKTTWWYVGLIAVGLVLAGVSVLLQWWSFLVVVVLSVVSLLIYATRPPRMLRYSLSDKGLSEGERLYAYSDFKAFGLLHENGQDMLLAVWALKQTEFELDVTRYGFTKAQKLYPVSQNNCMYEYRENTLCCKFNAEYSAGLFLLKK